MKITDRNAPLNRLKDLRLAWDINIIEFSKDVEISKSMLDYMERGERRLSYKDAVKISEYFGMTPDEIFYDDYKEFFKDILI